MVLFCLSEAIHKTEPSATAVVRYLSFDSLFSLVKKIVASFELIDRSKTYCSLTRATASRTNTAISSYCSFSIIFGDTIQVPPQHTTRSTAR